MKGKCKILIFVALALIIAQKSEGQVTLKTDLSEKEQKWFAEAKKTSSDGEFKKSNKKYDKILESKPYFVEGILRLASNYYSEKKLEESEILFAKAIKIAPDFDAEMYYSMATVQSKQNKYLDAAKNFELYVIKAKGNSDKVKVAQKLAENLRFMDFSFSHPVPFVPHKLGNEVNSSDLEYSPSIAIDGSSMIFTRNINDQEDFYISSIDSLGFKTAQPIFKLNTAQNEGAHTMSADGKYFVFTACDRKDAFGSCDLYYSMLINGEWSTPANMGHKVNSAAWDSQPTLSSDGRTLLFSSRRKGTLGGADLWMTYRNSKNAWVTPVNLGPTVNSERDEESPFLHPDDQTLYFRSNGWPGMGGFDIFYSQRNDTTGVWQKPKNIGYPINTNGEEGAFVVSLDGLNAYFASDMDYITHKKMGQLDINTFELYSEARPKPTTYIKAYVRDHDTKKPMQVEVTIKDLNSGKNVFNITTDMDGYFISGIAAGKNYACIVEHKDYFYYAQNFDLTAVKTLYKPYQLDIELMAIPKVIQPTSEIKPTILHNIFFKTGSAELLPESETEINLLFQLLLNNPTMHIKITGHTDNVGKDEDNLLLSQQRAKSVVNQLIFKGVDVRRISFEGKGETMPIFSNETEEGRQKNRRTEFLMVPKN